MRPTRLALPRRMRSCWSVMTGRTGIAQCKVQSAKVMSPWGYPFCIFILPFALDHGQRRRCRQFVAVLEEFLDGAHDVHHVLLRAEQLRVWQRDLLLA